MEKKKLLIIAHTPFHIVLAHSIAREHPDFKADIFIVGDFADSELLTECLKESGEHAFAGIFHLPGNYGLPKPDDEIFVRRKNVGVLKKHLADTHIDKLLTFNDNQAESQAAYFFASRKNENTVWAAGEDGGGLYGDFRGRELSKDVIDWYRRYYGSWWKPAVILGENPSIAQIWATFPNLIRPELKDKEICAVPREHVLELKKSGWPLAFFTKIGGSLETVGEADSLAVLAHSDFSKLHPNYALTVDACISILNLAGHRFAYKLHPRENDDAALPADEKNAVIVPKSFPVELLFLMLPRPLRCIIGDQTSALMTARWLSESTKVYSLAALLYSRDERLMESFVSAGIIKLSDFSDLQEGADVDEKLHVSTLYSLLSRMNNGYSGQLVAQSSRILDLESELISLRNESAESRRVLTSAKEAYEKTIEDLSKERERIEKEYNALYNSRAAKAARFIRQIVR